MSGEKLPRAARALIKALDNAQAGTLAVTGPDGVVRRFGGGAPGPDAEWRIYDWSVVVAMAARGDIGLGETYVAGLWDSPNPEALVRFGLANIDHIEAHAYGGRMLGWLLSVSDRVLRRNSRAGGRRNIRAHYDVGNDFYELWLDSTMTYSSALFTDLNADLRAAQTAKYDRILANTNGESVLEIGCGWGGFAERAADAGRVVTGVTISEAQLDYARNRLGDHADLRLQDYRDVRGEFDSIVSIEMIEAVGMRYWPIYFKTLRDRLAKGGAAMVQAIVIRDDLFESYAKRSDYIRRYIFPGGMLPSVAKVREHAARAGLALEAPFQFGEDYARTLRLWKERFLAAETRISEMGYGQEFRRSWLFYLDLCAASFASGRVNVAQLRLTHAA